MNTLSPRLAASARAFSYVEVLVTVIIVGILAGVAFQFGGQNVDAVRQSKLESDVATVNQAIRVYLANGGSLEGISTAQSVLDKLKTRRTTADGQKYAGLRNDMIDKRMRVRLQTSEEASSNEPRALWNSGLKRFEVAKAGANGVAEFYLDQSLAAVDFGTEAREQDTLDLNTENGWIWAFNDNNPSSGPSPTNVPLSSAGSDEDEDGSAGGSYPSDTDGSSGGEDPDTDPDPDNPDTDDPSDPDNPGGGGDTDPEEDPETDDPEATEPTKLDPPLFSISEEQINLFSFPLNLGLTNPNDPLYSTIVYQVNGGSWMSYGGELSVEPHTQVRAKVISLDKELYTDSDDDSRMYRPVLGTISGATSARFTNPQGPSGMIQSIQHSGSDSQFRWGDTSYYSHRSEVDLGPQNELRFTGHSFSQVAMGDKVKVGDFFYYNGTILTGSEAEEVSMNVEFTLDEPINVTLTTQFTFALENTVNSNDQYASADYVRLQLLNASTSQVVEGVRYNISLEFGTSTESGFTSVSQFHVFEQEGATAELWATVTPEGYELLEDGSNPIADLLDLNLFGVVYPLLNSTEVNEVLEDALVAYWGMYHAAHMALTSHSDTVFVHDSDAAWGFTGSAIFSGDMSEEELESAVTEQLLQVESALSQYMQQNNGKYPTPWPPLLPSVSDAFWSSY